MSVRPLISLCMIVRDEEALLGRCLEAARKWVDEVCIVDTGSTDGTVALAQSFAARVEQHPWNDSFAEARNRSLEMARGDWILVLDADEVLRQDDLGELQRIASQPAAEGAMLRFTHATSGGDRPGWMLRYFRNRPEHRYEGIIHEQVSRSIEASVKRFDGKVVGSRMHVDHYGYERELWIERKKAERNLGLLERAMGDVNENAYLAYKHADLLRAHPDRERMHAAFVQAAHLVDLDARRDRVRPFHAEVFALWAHELLRDGELAWAANLVERGARVGPATAHLHFVTGQVRLAQGRAQSAFEAFSKCRALDGTNQVATPSPGITSWRSGAGLLRSLIDLGRLNEAAEFASSEASAHPEQPELALVASEALTRAKQHARAAEICMVTLRQHPRHAELWARCAELMKACGLARAAEHAADRARTTSTESEPKAYVEEPLALSILGV